MSEDGSGRDAADRGAELEEIFGGLPTSGRIIYASSEPEPDADEFDYVAKSAVVVISFSEKGFGFGEVAMTQTAEGLFLDTERMGTAKVLEILAGMLANAITDVETDPEKHALYNRVKKRSCWDGCPSCAAWAQRPQ